MSFFSDGREGGVDAESDVLYSAFLSYAKV